LINQYSSNYPAQDFANFNNFIAIDSNQAAKLTAVQFAHEATSYNVLGISSSVGKSLAQFNLIQRYQIKVSFKTGMNKI
jgi:hypothetical protein